MSGQAPVYTCIVAVGRILEYDVITSQCIHCRMDVIRCQGNMLETFAAIYAQVFLYQLLSTIYRTCCLTACRL